MMIRGLGSLAMLLSVALTPSQASAADLDLVCQGAVRGMFVSGTSTGHISDNWGNSVGIGGTRSDYGDAPTTAIFRVRGEKAELNLPQPPSCAICSGEKGWRKVKDLSVSDERISGRITYSLFYGTKFEIDRRTGVMTSSNGFSGTCSKQDTSTTLF